LKSEALHEQCACEQWRQLSTPNSTSVSVPLYAIIVWSIAAPYSMSVSVALYAITARGLLQISMHQVALHGMHGIGFMFLSLHVIVPDKRHGEG
jgi:hypothetical protein